MSKKCCTFAAVMKKIALSLIVLALSWSAFAIPTYDLSYRLSGMAGASISQDLKPEKNALRPTLGGSFVVEFNPTGRWHCLQQWNNATIGVGASYMNLGNDSILGHAVNLYGSFNFPFYHSRHFRIGIRPSVGISICNKRYSNTCPVGQPREDNPNETYVLWGNDGGFQKSNQHIGSILNGYMAAEIFMDFPIRDGWEITANGGWYHISNCSFMAPNGGYNIFGGELGVRYHPQKRGVFTPRTDVPRRLWDGVDKPWAVEISASGGARQNYYRDNIQGMHFFGVAALKVAAYWVPISIFRLGAGFDAFYDGYYACVTYDPTNPDKMPGNAQGNTIGYFGKTYLAESDVKNCFRVGFSIQPELIIGKLTAGIHVGVYLFDPVKNLEPFAEAKAAAEKGESLNKGIFYNYDFTRAGLKEDGWCYMHFVLKYHVLDHMFIQIGMKSHGLTAEFLDAGLGVAF